MDKSSTDPAVLEYARGELEFFGRPRTDVVRVDFPASLTADLVFSDGTAQRVTGYGATRMGLIAARRLDMLTVHERGLIAKADRGQLLSLPVDSCDGDDR